MTTTKKELYFVASTRDDLSAMPQDVKDTMGHALYLAQQGGKAIGNVKPLSSLGHGVMQISDDYDGNTYRAVYTVHYEDAIYVLHCFQKKSKSGIATPQADIDVINLRLKHVAKLEAEKAKKKKAALQRNQTAK